MQAAGLTQVFRGHCKQRLASDGESDDKETEALNRN